MVKINVRSPSSSTTTTSNNVKHPRYIGDLKVEHFISPRRASRNLTFIKNKHHETIKKLKISRKKARRLQNRVKTLWRPYKSSRTKKSNFRKCITHFTGM